MSVKVGIIVAMDAEYNLVRERLENVQQGVMGSFLKGNIGTTDIVLAKSGIGKVNAAITTFRMLTVYSPSYVVNTGVAGSLDARVDRKSVVIGTKVKYHDVWCGKPNARGQVQGEPEWFPCMDVSAYKHVFQKVSRKYSDSRTYMNIVCSPIVSGDWFMETPANRLKALHVCGTAKAVDMESGAVAQVCCKHGVPFLPIRAISDIVGSDKQPKMYAEYWQDLADRCFDLCMDLIAEIHG